MKTGPKPFLRWAGSKKQILEHLAPFGANAERYVEPFAGSACLFYKLKPKRAVLADLNGDLIEMYQSVAEDAESVFAELSSLHKSETEYRRIRALDTALMSRTERAARFIYLNRYCFNGLYRTNASGKFNVPYGALKSGSTPDLEQLKASAELFRSALFLHGRFQETLSQVKEGDFVYMDPPFSVAAKRTFKEYDATVFSQGDLIDLRSWMIDLAARGIAFLVSYAECDESAYLADGFKVSRISVKRHIAGSFSNRVSSDEVLIYP